MREFRSSGSVEGVMGNHDPYSDSLRMTDRVHHAVNLFAGHDTSYPDRYLPSPIACTGTYARSFCAVAT